VYRKTELPNGVRVVTERIEHVKSASVGIWVNVGSRDEQEHEGGISHLIEHMIFKGTTRRTALDIAKEIDQVGGMSNAFTSKELTCFHAKVMSDHIGMVSDLLTDIFLNSVYDEEELERERQVILQEIRMIEDTPDELVHILFARKLWPDDPVGRPVMGTVETVSRIDRERIKKYLSRTYIPARIVISAAGDIEHDKILDLIGPAFTGIPTHVEGCRNRPLTEKNGPSVFHKDLEQVHLCLGSRFPDILDERRFAAAILNIILGGNMSSRLFQEIREKRGLAYSIFSFFSAYYDTGMLGIYAGVEPARTRETVRIILDELDHFRQGRLESSELKAAQEHLKGSIILGAESVDNRMMRLAKNEITFGRYYDFDEILDKVNAVTMHEIVELSGQYLQDHLLSGVFLGPLTDPGDGLGLVSHP
jgi:predicted Zn-dependent peptidase